TISPTSSASSPDSRAPRLEGLCATSAEMSDLYNRLPRADAKLRSGGTRSMTAPDLFTNVHKGIRKALFEACEALGRATDDNVTVARERLREALRFVAHHGENEDQLLLPRLERAAPEIHRRLQAAHAEVAAASVALEAAVERAPVQTLYLRACEFLSLYLEHMREEEVDLEGSIR